MSLATTTLSVACAAGDTQIVVASATSLAAGRIVLIDQEMMRVVSSYVSGTTAGVLRGHGGTKTAAHVVTANVVHGLPTDFADPATGNPLGITYPTVRSRILTSITATSTLTLPPAGTDLDVVLNGTAAITLTVPVPTKDMDGTRLTIIANDAAGTQHILTVTGGVGGASTGYTTWTYNATAMACASFVACNGAWVWLGGGISSGTTTAMASVIS